MKISKKDECLLPSKKKLTTKNIKIIESREPRDIHRYFISTVKYDDVLMWVYAQNIRGRKLGPNTKRDTSIVISELIKSCNPQRSLDVLSDNPKEVDKITSEIKYGDLWCIYKISPSSECIICKSRSEHPTIPSSSGEFNVKNTNNAYGIKMTVGETPFPLRILYYCGVCTNNIISIAEKCIFELGNQKFEEKINILLLVKKAICLFVNEDCCGIVLKRYISITFFNEIWFKNKNLLASKR